MLDYFNSLFDVVSDFWSALFKMGFYGSVTWGFLLIAFAIVNILVSFFIGKIK